MAAIGTTNIKFSDIKTAYNSANDYDLTNPISLSEFRSATFTDSTSVPSATADAININSHFKGKTFS